MNSDPFIVACPRCGSTEHFPCRTPTGFRAGIHKERWRMIGIKKPTPNQIVALYALSKMHLLERASRATSNGER